MFQQTVDVLLRSDFAHLLHRWSDFHIEDSLAHLPSY
jgi:hypothetical protein